MAYGRMALQLKRVSTSGSQARVVDMSVLHSLPRCILDIFGNVKQSKMVMTIQHDDMMQYDDRLAGQECQCYRSGAAETASTQAP